MLLEQERRKVVIHCKLCGEKYVLVGKIGKSGRIETGFKRCVCENDEDFDHHFIPF